MPVSSWVTTSPLSSDCLWREKRGEAEPPDYSTNLIVQLGLATEALNRRWYEQTTGQVIKDVQRRIRHPVIRWLGATLDGLVEASGGGCEWRSGSAQRWRSAMLRPV
jgi:predicted phage-related endonuclease